MAGYYAVLAVLLFVLSICLAYMNMFARFDKNPAMTLQDIKKKKRYGRTHGRTDVKTVYPPQTKFAGGIINYASVSQHVKKKFKTVQDIVHGQDFAVVAFFLVELYNKTIVDYRGIGHDVMLT